MALKGYRSYQGRGVRLKRAIIAILCVLVSLTVAVLVVFRRYPVLAEDGSLLWEKLWSWEPSQSPQEEQSSPSQTEQGTEQQTETVTQTQPQTAETDTIKVLLPLTELPLTSLPEDVTGVVYTVKDDAGRIYYPSAAGQRDAVTAKAEVQQELMRLCGQENIYAVARLNCFHDSYYAYTHVSDAALCSDGKLWVDERSYYWLDAEKQAARSYVIALAKECAELGFDEILLEELCYPTSSLTTRQHNALVAFLEELHEELDEAYDVRLTLLLHENHCENADLLNALLSLVDGVYTEQEASRVRSLMGEEGKHIPLLVWTDDRWVETSA